MAGMLPVGTTPDDPLRKLSFFWSLPVAAFDDWRMAGRDAWLRQLHGLWPKARERLGDDFDAACLARAAYRDAIPRRWWRGRAVLLGDAAHAMSPQLGQGANMALLDAWALAIALEQETDLDRALHRYARLRGLHVRIYQALSFLFTPFYQSDSAALPWIRDRLLWPLSQIPPVPALLSRMAQGRLIDPMRGARSLKS